MRAATRLIQLLALVMLASPVRAVQPDEILPDPKMEAKARAISAELRCLICQNQSIDDSDAPLARDLRLLVRDRLKAGDSESSVREFVVARYGEFVLLKPPFAGHTLILWLGPFIVLGLGVIAILMGRRRPAAAPPVLDRDEKARLDALLGEEKRRG